MKTFSFSLPSASTFFNTRERAEATKVERDAVRGTHSALPFLPPSFAFSAKNTCYAGRRDQRSSVPLVRRISRENRRPSSVFLCVILAGNVKKH